MDDPRAYENVAATDDDDDAGPEAHDVMLYSVRRRVDAWLVTVLLAVVFVVFVGIVPSDVVRPLDYAERVYLATVVAAGALLVAGYTATVADVRVALNSTLFYAIFCAGVVPRHAYLLSLDGTTRLAMPYFSLYLGLAGLVYLLLCIVQRRFPGDVVVTGDDPVLNLHHAMDLMHAIFVMKAFRGVSNYTPYYSHQPRYHRQAALTGTTTTTAAYREGVPTAPPPPTRRRSQYHSRRASTGDGWRHDRMSE